MSSASALFAERSFERVSVDDVAERASIGKGSVYRQFGSKEQLYASVVIEGFAELRDQIEKALPRGAKSTRVRLTTLVTHIMSYFWDRRQFFTLLHDPAKLPRRQATQYREQREQLVKLVRKVLVEGARNSEIRRDFDFDLMAEAMLGMMRGINRYQHDSVNVAEAIQAVVEIFLSGCADNSRN